MGENLMRNWIFTDPKDLSTHTFYSQGKNRNFTMEKPGRQNLSQKIKVNMTSNTTQQHHMPHVKMQ